MGTDARVFRELRSVLVESIFWDERTDDLVWVDITTGLLHRARLDGAVDGSEDRVVELPPPVSAVQPATGGGFVVALKDRVALLDADGRLVRDVAATPHRHGGIRNNEGKVDPFGRFLVGGMDLTSGEPDAALFAVTAEGDAALLRGGFSVANGFEWSDDGDEMYLTDTSTRTVYRAPYGPGADPLGELTPFLAGHPSDGLTRDREGGFWNGLYGDGEVVHWSADGAVDRRHPLPVPNVTSVAFGGPDFATLFVGSGRENLTEEQLEAHPLSGSIFALDVGTRGYPPHVFGETTP